MKKQSSLSRLFTYAGSYKILTILSWVLSVISAWIALELRSGRAFIRLWLVSSAFCIIIYGNLYWRFNVFSYCGISGTGKYEIGNDAPYCDITIRIYG